MDNVNEIEGIIEELRSKKKQKIGTLAYWVYIEEKYILKYVNVSFLKKDRKEALKVISEIQNMNDFVFWCDSKKGKKFYSDKYNKIVDAFKTQQIKPWLSYEYGVGKPESEVSEMGLL